MKIKYFQERERDSGTIYVVNPPKYVKEATGAVYQQFTDKEEAVTAALRVAEQFQDYRKGKTQKIYVDESTVEGLVSYYQTTDKFKKLKKNSKTHYRLMFKTAMNLRVGQANMNFGQMFAKNITPAFTDKFHLQIKENISLHRANACVKVMRCVWNVALRHEKVLTNPWHGMELTATPVREVMWERHEVTAAIEAADKLGLYNLGTLILLCYHLCQRPGDMRQLTWGQFTGNSFRFVQEKTGTRLELDASPDIIDRFDAYTHRPNPDLIVVNDENGLPYDRYSYAKQLRRVRLEAGLRAELTMGDLRRTGATEMAESGATEDELAATTGHKSREILRTYVRPTRRVAQNGFKKRFG